MFLEFRVKNFKSLNDETTLSMLAKDLPDAKRFALNLAGGLVMPVAAVYGANASGKTNLLEALFAFRRCIAVPTLFFGSRSKRESLVPFLFDEQSAKEPVKFEVRLLSENRRMEYLYGFSINGQTVEAEWLYERKFSKTEEGWDVVFERTGQTFECYPCNGRYRDVSEIIDSILKENTLAISWINLIYTGAQNAFTEVRDWALDCSYIDVAGSMNLQNVLADYSRLAGFKVLEDAREFIKTVDPSIENIEVVKQVTAENEKVYKAYTYHNGKRFDLQYESDGIRKVFALYLQIFIALSVGGVLILDDLDAQVHPLLLRKIVHLFQDKTNNPRGAQLIFSAHNTAILNAADICKDEIWFVEKDDVGGSQLFSLVELESVGVHGASGLSYEHNYLAGEYGAVPFSDRGIRDL